jgi:hypothetical protein
MEKEKKEGFKNSRDNKERRAEILPRRPQARLQGQAG